MTRKKISIKTLRNILLTFLAFMIFAFFLLDNAAAASTDSNAAVDISMKSLFVISVLILAACLVILARELLRLYGNRHNRQVLS
jgi:hypothetical protein